jgi:hypothetical protein
MAYLNFEIMPQLKLVWIVLFFEIFFQGNKVQIMAPIYW